MCRFLGGMGPQELSRSGTAMACFLTAQRDGKEYSSNGADVKIGEDVHKTAGLGIAEGVDLPHWLPNLQPRSTVRGDFGAKGFIDESSSTLSFQCLVLTIDEKVCRKALRSAVILA